MAETPEAVTTSDEKQANDDFSAGFASEKPLPTKTEGKPEPEQPKAEPKPEPKAEAAKPAPKTEAKPEPPKYAQVTQQEWDDLKASANKTAAIETQLSKAFGTIGDVQQIVRKLQAATPQGLTVELPEDVVSEMEADYPELAGHFRKGIEKALKGVKGTASTTAAQTADPDAVQKLVQAAVVKRELEALEDDHPTWRETVGAVTDGNYDPNHPFRKWLATQDAGYQQKVNSTNSSAVISRAIDKFEASKTATAKPDAKETPSAKVAARTDRIRDAIQPKGDGGQPTLTKSADDDFLEGFRGG